MSLLFRLWTFAQTIEKNELIFLTSEWKRERFDEGRLKIPYDLLERANKIGVDDAWTVLENDGNKTSSKAIGKWFMMMCP
tara:strand:- start:2580 stop:2819 length:240 start_codon:yes stop_codon:yes gene_type:complete